MKDEKLNNELDYKLKYMSHLFANISKKKIELYVISRIWHQLNDDKVKFVIQQYIRRTQDKYALADLYLPQIGMFIEINENFHKKNKEIDDIRNEEIRKVTGTRPFIIDCGTDKKISDVHFQISELINIIRREVENKGESFVPWSNTADGYRKKGYLRVEDNEYVRTIDDVCDIFKTKAIHRGYLRAAGANIPNKEGVIIWCPNANNKKWSNTLSENGEEIREYNTIDEQKRKKHIEEALSMDQRRITFFKGKDELGLCDFRFVGVFKLDKEKTKAENKCVWHRESDCYLLNDNIGDQI